MRRIIGLLAGVALSLCFASTAFAAKGNWDHAANIKDAAGRLALLHKREGSQGVLKFLDACYRTHLLASDYTKGLEACMAQDYMHTQILATIYSKLPEEERKKLGVPSPEMMAQGMGQRFTTAFQQYKVAVTEANDFKALVDKHGFPVFVKAVFPKDAAKADDAGKPDAAKPAAPTGDK